MKEIRSLPDVVRLIEGTCEGIPDRREAVADGLSYDHPELSLEVAHPATSSTPPHLR